MTFSIGNVIWEYWCLTTQLLYFQDNSYSECFNRKTGRYMFRKVTRFLKTWNYSSMLKICAPKMTILKYFSKPFELQLLQGSYTVKNYLLDFFVTKITQFSESSSKRLQVQKSIHWQMLYKNRLSLAFQLMPLTWNFA